MNKPTLLALVFLGIVVVFGSWGIYSRLSSSRVSNPESDCKATGCSNQLCEESSSPGLVTTCEYKNEYACYQKAKCERQVNGNCGWTMDESLESCLGSFTAK